MVRLAPGARLASQRRAKLRWGARLWSGGGRPPLSQRCGRRPSRRGVDNVLDVTRHKRSYRSNEKGESSDSLTPAPRAEWRRPSPLALARAYALASPNG